MDADIIYVIKVGRIVKNFFFIENAINYYKELLNMNKEPQVWLHFHIENQIDRYAQKII